MNILHKLAFLPALLLAATSAGITPETVDRSATKGSAADFSTAPRVNVDKPVELIPLYLRDKRIHGLKPLQALVDAAPEGSVLALPAGNYAANQTGLSCRLPHLSTKRFFVSATTRPIRKIASISLLSQRLLCATFWWTRREPASA